MITLNHQQYYMEKMALESVARYMHVDFIITISLLARYLCHSNRSMQFSQSREVVILCIYSSMSNIIYHYTNITFVCE